MLAGDHAAKYVNSPESDIYHKSNVLYGLYFAKKAIVTHDNCYLVEGYAEKLSADGRRDEAEKLLADFEALVVADDLAGMKTLIETSKIPCAVSNTCNWTDVRQFNLMFSTELGSVAEDANTIYLRPETAQGIFVNFLNVQKTGRMKIPFGIAQTGKAFRNEIVARQFIFRMREFEQMEMQFFVRPGTQREWYEHWKAERLHWMKTIMHFQEDKLMYHDHAKPAHYADAAVDIEFLFPFGWKELEGIHSRTDYDLGRHQEFSRKKQQYFDTEINQNYVPYVIETSVGLDRLVLATLSNAYAEEKWQREDGSDDSRTVLRIPANLAPTKLAVLPLTKKDGLPEIARELVNNCKPHFHCFYEEKDSIGKRYRRMDAIGTPYAVTIDHQTKEDQTVTLRDRDTMTQERIPLAEVKSRVLNAVVK